MTPLTEPRSHRRACLRSICHACVGAGRYLRIFIVVLTLLLIPVAEAQQAKVSEYQVKATYLYNFGRFVQWPATATASKSDSFSICVLGQDPFGPTLDTTLAGEKLEGKPLTVKRISAPQDAGDCRILFISSTEERDRKSVV